MRSINILVLFIFFSLKLVAQTNFYPGFIVKVNGDTIKGFIDERSYGRNREKCDFKLILTDTATQYTPFDITAYGINNSTIYISREFELEKKKVKLFLELIIQGRITIFYFRDALGDHYLIEKTPYGLTELPYKLETISTDAGFFQKPSKKHIGILKYYLADAPNLFPKIEQMEMPTRKALIEIAKTYQSEVCKDTACTMFVKKTEKIKINYEITQGLIHSFDDPKFYRYELGGIISISLPNLNKRLNLKSGFYYSRPTNNDFLGSFNLLRFPIELQYKINDKKISPLLEFGYCINSYDLILYHNLYFGLGFTTKIEKRVNLIFGTNATITPFFSYYNGSPIIVSHSLYLGLQF